MNMRELLKLSEELDMESVDGDEPVQALAQEEEQKEVEQEERESEEAIDEQPGELPSVSDEVLEEADTPQVDGEEVAEAELPEPDAEELEAEPADFKGADEEESPKEEPEKLEITEPQAAELDEPEEAAASDVEAAAEQGLPEPEGFAEEVEESKSETLQEWRAESSKEESDHHQVDEVTENPVSQSEFDDREARQAGEIFDATMQRINRNDRESQDFASSLVDGVKPMFDDLNLRLEVAFNEQVSRMISEQEMLRTY